MRATRYLTCLAAAILLATPVASAEPVKVGIIAPFSGPFSSFGETWKQGIAAYLQPDRYQREDHDRSR